LLFLDPGSEILDSGSGIGDGTKIRIRDKHPGSATLVKLVLINTIKDTGNNDRRVEKVGNLIYCIKAVPPSYGMMDIKN
jgi:hypothetical protein